MRINLGNKAYLYPQPVLIIATFDKDNNPDAMNAAWGFNWYIFIIRNYKISLLFNFNHIFNYV